MPAAYHSSNWRSSLRRLRATYVDFSDFLPGKKSTSDSRYQGDWAGDKKARNGLELRASQIFNRRANDDQHERSTFK